MADLDSVRQSPEKAVLDALDATRAGMLHVEGSDLHPQPMTHHLDRVGGQLWFIADRYTDLVGAVGQGAEARFTVTTKAQDIYLSLVGPIEQVENEDRLTELWTPVASAFFDGESPVEAERAILLRLTFREAAIWASPRNPVILGLQFLRAATGGSSDDLGYHTIVNLAA
ncbi:pyridoxamine 5'-phosphate oxidase family protein [Tropicimonas sp. IMCC6043]|uniref:pyridoxamine 5'-phosphate oxidase family protein n=1 Tax=Tropicimonas sp. IMCC6043 TaxID=2510645 RepID=UPI00101BCBB1|nr:pyridoxamine 5'-phosphate oxidase family protein [Tropicimonas sp. IMCC6043]RYH07715.1 general stress protein [Tropicimonas sp. IMCC6043]